MEGQEHHVGGGAQLQHARAEEIGALVRPLGLDLVQVGGGAAHLLGGFGHRGVEEGVQLPRVPLQAEKHVHQGRPVAQAPQGLGDHGARGQGNIPLRGQAPGQHYDIHNTPLN